MTKAKMRVGSTVPILSAGEWSFCFLSVLVLMLLIRNSEIAIELISSGLSMCVRTVIPSLFPFLILSELMVRTGAGEAIASVFSPVFAKLFRVSGVGFGAVFLGSICGFPVGASTVSAYYQKGLLNKDEAERLLIYSNHPSSAFVISAVGISMFGSRRFGAVLYGLVLLSSFLVGIVSGLISKVPVMPNTPVQVNVKVNIREFTDSVSDAAICMLRICAYIVFFSAVTGCAKLVLTSLGLSQTVRVLLVGGIEMTSGLSEAAILQNRTAAAVIAGVVCAWSGLCVHMQILSVGGSELCYRKYFIGKLAAGIVCGALMYLTVLLFPSVIPEAETLENRSVLFQSSENGIPVFVLIAGICFLVSLGLYYFNNKGGRHRYRLFGH